MNKNILCVFKRGTLSTVLILFILLAPSCKKEPEVEPDPDDKNGFVKVNDWVTEEMRTYYYWNKSIPVNAKLNFNLEPEDFFESILDKDDRFSWIDKADNLKDGLAGVSTTTGLNFGLVRDGNTVIGYVRYVIPESPADLAGIERGMFFTRVNGQRMTVENYNSILDPYYKGQGFSVQLAELAANNFVETSEIKLVATRITEPAVYLYNTITTVSGRKVGYLFYNRFLSDDNPDKKIHSDDLFEAFQYFKANGVQDLILDVRYNLGGSIAVSGLLSALMMPNYDENKIFVEYRYNDDLNELFDSFRFHSFKSLFSSSPAWGSKIPGANLNLNKVYVLATLNSASASELVINNLRPYMDVIHIGETTRGKNEGSITIEDERIPRQIDWAIQPIILKLANSLHYGDYHDGLDPSIVVKEGYELKPLGDKEDPLVKAALNLIDPSMSARGRTTPPRVLSMLQGIKSFDEINNKAQPVLVDETINKELLRRRIK